MRKHRGTILLSVLSFIFIFSTFETYRYLNYVQRQQVYHLLIDDYQHLTSLSAQKKAESRTHKNSVTTN
ncbi:hypothetical protein [Lactobacillus sp. CBA3606] [Lactiplantibacillus mudanjiangensis]|uniref:hypothetical protein n=1 Tax=Lactiplantibacillus mudanjiangensis TaxID=1296538 RepID=UPI00101431FD|nr:hypothetical protein [Lactobacillus sp. CBA3606] [Lactiplantibacillus mudanjiangensis]